MLMMTVKVISFNYSNYAVLMTSIEIWLREGKYIFPMVVNEQFKTMVYVTIKRLQAGNMSSGHLHEVAARIKSKQPAALHVHCLSHSLNLCLQDAAHTCAIVRDKLELVMELYKLIKYFPKCISLFEAMKSQTSPNR